LFCWAFKEVNQSIRSSYGINKITATSKTSSSAIKRVAVMKSSFIHK
jgi:hypothetical protein